MDFLDPKAKRRHTIRLIIGYGLMAVLIAIATIILVFSAYGFDVNRKTGEVIQNGLVFVDSAPDGAQVVFNGEIQPKQTNNRFALPSGQYDLKIQKDGYRDWTRKFAINGGEVERFTYPLLIPNELNRRAIQAYEAAPTFSSESPDRRWLIVNQGNSLTNFIEYDLNTLDDNDVPAARPFAVPAGVFAQKAGNHSLELVEWSNDNKHLLVKHNYSGGYEFVVLSRDEPETSININRLLGLNPTKIELQDKKFDKWYLYYSDRGILQLADVDKKVEQLLSGVTAFKTHGTDTILYSQKTADGQKQRISLFQGSETYVVKEVANGRVLLEIARYDNEWYVVIGADAEHKTYIYQNPTAVLERRDGTMPVPRSVLKAEGKMTKVSFSQNTRFILTQSGQHFESFDAEYNLLYRYDIDKKFDPGTDVVWMDGHRLLARHQGKAFIFDYDGANQQELVNSQPGLPVMFDRDYTVLYSIAKVEDKIGLYATDLRLEEDR